jgi:pimeloyl-ACP methyl ester carboxylesterase
MNTGRHVRRALAALSLALCALGAGAGSASYPVNIAGSEVEATWHWPDDRAAASVVLLQHGFTRRCANLRGLASAISEAGHLVLCLNADMAGGNTRLAAQLANAMQRGALLAPDGGALPRRVVLGGHSAGAAFAALVAAELGRSEPGRVESLLLLDPVGLRLPLQQPLLAIVAPPMRCNAMQQALPALSRSPQAEVVQLAQGAAHIDAEGDDTDALARAACAPGEPQPANVLLLRELVLRWLAGDAQPAIDAALREGRLTRITRAAPQPPR